MIRNQTWKPPPVWSNMSHSDKVIEFCCGYSKILRNHTYVFIISTKPRDKWHNFLDFLNDVIAEEYSASRNERRIAMKRILMKRWRLCLMLTIYKLYLTPRPVTKLIKMYRSRLYQKRPTWLVYLKTSSLSNRYQSEKKLCILLARLGKLTEDGNSLPVLAPCNLSSLFFNNYKHKRSVFNVKSRETSYLSV